MSKTIEIRDVGPIERLEITLPKSGLCVLKGANGSGKSLALQSVQALVDGGGKVASRDGSMGAQVEGVGARLTLGRRATLSGEVEVSHIEGTDPSVLVDPQIKDPAAADARRMQAILRLARARVDLAQFAELVGGETQLRELCRPASLELMSDVPAAAAAIKRDIEAAARKAEGEAANLQSKVEGVRLTLKELGGGPVIELVTGSVEVAREAHTAAVRAHSALVATRDQNGKLLRSATEARTALARMGTDGTAEAIESAKQNHSAKVGAIAAADERVKEADAVVHRIELDLERAKAAAREAQAEGEQARRAARSAEGLVIAEERAAEQRATLQRAVDSAADVTDVTDAALDEAAGKVDAASAELEKWAMRERTAKVRNDLADLEQKGKVAQEAADELRAAARGVERVVLAAVQGVCGDDFELLDGRLYVRDAQRGRELFSDLSHGERWRRALGIAARSVGERGLLVIPQEGFEALDPENRAEVDCIARELGVVVLTAEAASGEVRSEVFEPEAQAS